MTDDPDTRPHIVIKGVYLDSRVLFALVLCTLCACRFGPNTSVRRLVMIRTTPAPTNRSPLPRKHYLLSVGKHLNAIGELMRSFEAQLMVCVQQPELSDEPVWRSDRASELAEIRTNAEAMQALIPPRELAAKHQEVVAAAEATLKLVNVCAALIDLDTEAGVSQCIDAATASREKLAALKL